jgi:hypothetical protein
MLASCAVQIKLTEPNNFTSEHPDLNLFKEVEVGVELVSKERGYKLKAILLTKSTVLNIGNINREFKKGQIFINDSYTNEYELYSIIEDKTFGIAIPKRYGTFTTFTKSFDSKIFFGDDISIEYIDTTVIAPNKNKFKQEFIYNGRVNNAVKFTYREFLNDYARPSFTQDLQYDLNESKVIGFKGLRIEIISATNIEIKYKVLNNFTN